jgi:hypothetical protein
MNKETRPRRNQYDWQHYLQIIEHETEGAMAASLKVMEMEKKKGTFNPLDPYLLYRNERLLRKKTDLAIRYWIKHRQFPWNPEIALYLDIRFNAALAFLEESNPIRPKFDAPEKRVLTWLLISHWRTEGRASWIAPDWLAA